MIKSLLAITLLASSVSASALAAPVDATLTGISGKVLINGGKGFRPVRASASVAIGDQVFISANSTATLHFNEANCDVVLAAASVTRISGPAMCQQAVIDQPAALRGTTADAIIAPVNGEMIVPPPPPPGGLISPLFIAGGIATIGTVAVISGTLQKDATPVSGP